MVEIETVLSRKWTGENFDRRLSPRDAEGRVALAGEYDRLLEDRDTAVRLLQEAWKIDPQSREVADGSAASEAIRGRKPAQAPTTSFGPTGASGWRKFRRAARRM